MTRWSSALVACAWVLSAKAGISGAAEPAPAPLIPFVLPWDDAAPGVADVSGWADRPAGKFGPLVVRDGHFFAGPKRVRLLGVNLCFGANFPEKADADKVAARMAKFGINCARFHHMDMFSAPNGIFAADGRTLDPGRLDRLDYLISKLKAVGIYSDLNLHVSRTYPGRPKWAGMPSFHKGVDNFDPAMIALQRDYARDLLTHKNPYTGSTYADEPAVALVEINNENSLIQDWWGGRLDAMPTDYSGELDRLWNAWLGRTYPDFAALKKAWGAADVPLGAELLAASPGRWNLERHQGAEATLDATTEAGKPVLRVTVTKPGQAAWHVQLVRAGLAFDGEMPYTLRFRARVDQPRELNVAASQNHAPWGVLWTAGVRPTSEWKEYQFTFSPGQADPRGRIVLGGLGSEPGTTWLADISLKPGGVVGMRPGDAAGSVAILKQADFASRSVAARRDWIRFLFDVETRYWTGMARYLKEDLGVKAPLVGTQMGWSPAPIQAQLDVIDSHAYWQHPDFGSDDWNLDRWSVGNVPMAGAPDGGTLPGLALARVAGKPFICTEYNHSAPNTFATETIPTIAAFAAAQDWDGVFVFAYSHRRDEWDARKIPSFFDVDQHPGKMATFPAAAALFLRGDVPTSQGMATVAVSTDAAIDRVRRSGPRLQADNFGLDRLDPFRFAVGLALDGPASSSKPAANSAFRWGLADGRRAFAVDSARSKALVGAVVPGETALGDVRLAVGPTRQGWAALTLTAVDGPDFHSPGRILVTATGDSENTAMGWKDASRTTVGRDWGRAPSLVEGIPASITLQVPPGRVRGWALDERGRRGKAVAVRAAGQGSTLAIGPEHRTIWYEIEIVR